MISLKLFDIVFADFPNEEDFNVRKYRPVLVLSAPDNNGYFKGAKITSTAASFRMRIAGGPPSNLNHDSWLDMTRIERIHITDVTFKIGFFPEDLKPAFKRYFLEIRKRQEESHK